MKQNRLTRVHLLLLALVVCSGVPVAAQEASRGTRGTATQVGVVNFLEAARQEKLAPQALAPQEPEAIRSPRTLPDGLSVPDSLKLRESASAAESDTAPRPNVSSPGTVASFPGGADSVTSFPPDTHGAVGPNHLMVALNGGNATNPGVRVMTREGAVISTIQLTAFFRAGLTIESRAFDPRVYYDKAADRWIVVAVTDSSLSTSSLVVAVSQTGDPTGNWHLFEVDADSSDVLWADYPSVGFNKNWIVVQVNMFPINSGTGTFTSNIYAFDKAKLYAGANAGGAGDHKLFSIPDTGTNRIGGTQAPAITLDPTLDTMYLVNTWNVNSNGQGFLRIFTITGAVGSETFTPTQAFPSAPGWGFSVGSDFAPQLDTSRKIQNNDQRVQAVVYRRYADNQLPGTLWVAQTIFLPAGGAGTRTAVQWWEINPTSGAVLQHGRIDDPTGASFYAFPSIAVNQFKDVLIGYSRFSQNQFASANYSFRAGTDAPGTLRDDVVFKSGEGIYDRVGGGRNRWGDFSATMVDPANDTDLWTIQEYAAAPFGTSGGSGRFGVWWARVSPTGAPSAPTPITVRFAPDSPVVNENQGTVQINVTRNGDTSAAAYVDYSTTDGTARDREDYHPALGTVRFAPGETTKTITVFLINDTYEESPKTFNLNLSNPRNCSLDTPASVTVTLTSDDAAGSKSPVRNESFDAAYFVRQHYLDFFNRVGDADGVNFWTNQITSCGTDAACLELKKINVSGAFFLSIEFQQTGYLVYRTYGAAFGTTRVGGRVPLTLREFLPDTQAIGRGVVVLSPGWEQQIESNKVAYFNQFVLRPAFLARYPTAMTPVAFVEALNTNTGGSLTNEEKASITAEFGGAQTSADGAARARALRRVVEDADFNAREKNRAFVLMQYFGYLRRNPPDAPEMTLDFQGYDFWLGKLNQFGGNFVAADMVKSFLISEEYKTRFGP